MPSYVELAQEQVWLDQYVPDNLTTLLIEPLRAFYSMGPTQIGAPGDNNHLYGRHRSAAWDRSSAYCTDRSYGTTDARDKRGDQNIYRAVDVGIQNQTLYDASRRLDELVRSGAAPGVAEWFGTFDGVDVVGWFQGRPSSSDDSHLWHLHVGFWNESADDPETLQAVLAAITGDDMTAEENWKYGIQGPGKPDGTLEQAQTFLAYANKYAYDAMNAANAAVEKLDEILALLQAGGGSPDSAPIIAAIRGEGELTRAEVRDAVADLGEGGATQVRDDPDA